MRYLTQSSNHSWTFRFQFPRRVRDYFYGQFEYKYSLGKVTQREARSKALELEKRLVDVIWRVEDAIERPSSYEGKELVTCKLAARMKVDMFLAVDAYKRVSASPKLQGALRRLMSGKNRQPLSLSASRDLQCIHKLYPSTTSPDTRAQQMWALIYDECLTCQESFKNKVKKTIVRHYKLMLEARDSLVCFDFSRFSRVLKALGKNAIESSTEAAPDECFEEFEQHPPLKNIAVDTSADITTSKVHEREGSTGAASASEVDIRWYCEQYQTHRNNKLGVRKNSEGVALEAQKTIEMCLIVHELIGVHDITQINVTHADHALSQLRAFPKVSNSKINKKRFHAFPKHQWVKINQGAGLEVISESTVGRYIEKTSTIYSWIRDNFPVQSINPFCGLASKSGGPVLDEEDNVASFSKNDLVKIFSQPIFTEHKIKRHYTKRIPKYSQYWMPLIALLSGMRPNEIAQLKRKDCVLRDGILFFQLSNQDEDQSLKNKRARRAVPVHSKLIELGFERFIEPLASDERLFPELSYSKKEGYYKSFGEWFKRYFSNYIDLAREGKRFYSFRHTFIDQFKQRGSIAAVPASIVGHKNGSITYDTYGSKADLATLRNYIETVKFDEVLKKVKPLK
ncbi:hypothetical protein VSAK1_10438 [Vibrio mediterranei AK1]|uniref:site-specific integrase n=1 Tax=Vibrio mediterranei TaxID=689 RepID=UPI0001541407|nr:tyrosine-type recombinase/integrase [Vibrio mediterranei]EDL53848.1 hypothetical protein VSAK1_10438 [Vibrio mediterranei AK1]